MKVYQLIYVKVDERFTSEIEQLGKYYDKSMAEMEKDTWERAEQEYASQWVNWTQHNARRKGNPDYPKPDPPRS